MADKIPGLFLANSSAPGNMKPNPPTKRSAPPESSTNTSMVEDGSEVPAVKKPKTILKVGQSSQESLSEFNASQKKARDGKINARDEEEQAPAKDAIMEVEANAAPPASDTMPVENGPRSIEEEWEDATPIGDRAAPATEQQMANRTLLARRPRRNARNLTLPTQSASGSVPAPSSFGIDGDIASETIPSSSLAEHGIFSSDITRLAPLGNTVNAQQSIPGQPSTMSTKPGPVAVVKAPSPLYNPFASAQPAPAVPVSDAAKPIAHGINPITGKYVPLSTPGVVAPQRPGNVMAPALSVLSMAPSKPPTLASGTKPAPPRVGPIPFNISFPATTSSTTVAPAASSVVPRNGPTLFTMAPPSTTSALPIPPAPSTIVPRNGPTLFTMAPPPTTSVLPIPPTPSTTVPRNGPTLFTMAPPPTTSVLPIPPAPSTIVPRNGPTLFTMAPPPTTSALPIPPAPSTTVPRNGPTLFTMVSTPSASASGSANSFLQASASQPPKQTAVTQTPLATAFSSPQTTKGVVDSQNPTAEEDDGDIEFEDCDPVMGKEFWRMEAERLAKANNSNSDADDGAMEATQTTVHDIALGDPCVIVEAYEPNAAGQENLQSGFDEVMDVDELTPTIGSGGDGYNASTSQPVIAQPAVESGLVTNTNIQPSILSTRPETTHIELSQTRVSNSQGSTTSNIIVSDGKEYCLLNTARDEVTSIQKSNAAALQERDDKIQQLTNMIAQLEASDSSGKNTTEDLQSQLHEQKEASSRFQRESCSAVEKKNEEINQLHKATAILEARVSTSEQISKTLGTELDEQKEICRELKEATANFETNISKMNIAGQSMLAELQTQKEEFKCVQGENKELSAQLQTAHQRIMELEGAQKIASANDTPYIKELRVSKANIEAELDKLKLAKETLEEELDEQSNIIVRLENEAANAKNKLQKSQEEATSTIKHLTNKIDELMEAADTTEKTRPINAIFWEALSNWQEYKIQHAMEVLNELLKAFEENGTIKDFIIPQPTKNGFENWKKETEDRKVKYESLLQDIKVLKSTNSRLSIQAMDKIFESSELPPTLSSVAQIAISEAEGDESQFEIMDADLDEAAREATMEAVANEIDEAVDEITEVVVENEEGVEEDVEKYGEEMEQVADDSVVLDLDGWKTINEDSKGFETISQARPPSAIKPTYKWLFALSFFAIVLFGFAHKFGISNIHEALPFGKLTAMHTEFKSTVTTISDHTNFLSLTLESWRSQGRKVVFDLASSMVSILLSKFGYQLREGSTTEVSIEGTAVVLANTTKPITDNQQILNLFNMSPAIQFPSYPFCGTKTAPAPEVQPLEALTAEEYDPFGIYYCTSSMTLFGPPVGISAPLQDTATNMSSPPNGTTTIMVKQTSIFDAYIEPVWKTALGAIALILKTLENKYYRIKNWDRGYCEPLVWDCEEFYKAARWPYTKRQEGIED